MTPSAKSKLASSIDINRLKAEFIRVTEGKSLILDESLQVLDIQEGLALFDMEHEQSLSLEKAGSYIDLTSWELLEEGERVIAYNPEDQTGMPVEFTQLTPKDIRYWYSRFETYLVSNGLDGFIVWVV